jgi:hypothetical protein
MALQLLDGDTRITVKDSDLADVENGDEGTTYTVRQMPPNVTRDLSKRHTTNPINKRTGQREQVVDHMALMDDTLDYALVAWSGIQHQGKDVPCEREYKALLDVPRKVALLGLAGMNQTAPDQKADSFRSPA